MGNSHCRTVQVKQVAVAPYKYSFKKKQHIYDLIYRFFNLFIYLFFEARAPKVLNHTLILQIILDIYIKCVRQGLWLMYDNG